MAKKDKAMDNRAFCFCVGSQVDCLPGVVLDCNNKRTTKCPLLNDNKNAEKQAKSDKTSAKKKKDNRAFCFCVGSQVDCLPGVVLDCNNKRTTQCPLLNDNKNAEKQTKSDKTSAKEKKDNRAFCFCLGSQVDCLPGVVLDCNNKRTTQCPLVQEVLSVNTGKEKQIEEFRENYKKNSKKKEKKGSKKKDNRAFCFCMGSQVDCLPGVVLDCNNKRTTECPLVKELVKPNEALEKQIQELKGRYNK